jgi:hypothetical protein
MEVIEMDWALKKANRVIKGYRIVGGRGRDLRDDIARALRMATEICHAETDEVEATPVQAPNVPLADRLKTREHRTSGGQKNFIAYGFKDEAEAKAWGSQWQDNNYGYTPLYSVATSNQGEVLAFCSIWSSSD